VTILLAVPLLRKRTPVNNTAPDNDEPMIKIIQLAVVSSMIEKDYAAAAEILHDLGPNELQHLINACQLTAAFARAEASQQRQ
jgi:hypothetical protein